MSDEERKNNRPEEGKKSTFKTLGKINDGWRGREAGFNTGLIENKIELIYSRTPV